MFELDSYLSASMVIETVRNSSNSPFPWGQGWMDGDSRGINWTYVKYLDKLSFDGAKIDTKLTTVDISKMFVRYWAMYNQGVLLEGAYDTAEELIGLVSKEVLDYEQRFKEFFGIVLPHVEISEESWSKCRERLSFHASIGNLAKWFKWEINKIFSNYFDTDCPEKPLILLSIFPREVNLQLKRMSSQRRSRKMSHQVIIYSIFQGLKKGLLPIRLDQIDKTLLDHCAALCPEKPNEILVNSGSSTFFQQLLKNEFSDLIVDPIVRSAREVRKVPLSNKSTVDYSRANGGQVGIARRASIMTVDECFFGVETNRRRFFLRAPTFLGYKTVESMTFNGTQLVSRNFDLKEVYTNDLTNEEVIEEILWLREFDIVRQHLVEPCVILEPLKGRMITKPSVGEYLGLNPMQRWLWQRLRQHRAFELIGRSVQLEDIYYMADSWKFGYGFNSGDFSGATDNLAGSVSELIMNFLLQRLERSESESIIREFAHSDIDYQLDPLNRRLEDRQGGNKWEGHYQDFVSCGLGVQKQKNGQLMGHVLSFIVLCLANYLIFRWSVKVHNDLLFGSYLESQNVDYADMHAVHRNLPSEYEVPRVLINGDDILFACDPAMYKTWCLVTRQFGLFPSVGKNLFSPEICQINSVLFDVRYASPVEGNFSLGNEFIRTINAVNYVNMGVITGRGKGKEDPIERLSISQCEELLDSLTYEIPSFGANLRIFQYTEKYIPVERQLQVFFNLRPKLSTFLSRNTWLWDVPFDQWGSICTDSASGEFEVTSCDLFLSTKKETSMRSRTEMGKYMSGPFFQFMYGLLEERVIERTHYHNIL